MSELLLYAYKAKQRIGLIENIESLQWLVEFQGAGEFKLICACVQKNIDLLDVDNILYNPDTPEVAGLITYTQRETDEKGFTKLEVRGEFTSGRWRKRVNVGVTEITNAASGITTLATVNKRGLDVNISAPSFSASTEYTAQWGDCYAAFNELAEQSGIGFRHLFLPNTAEETLQILKGVDRSDPSSANYVGYFGSLMQNISSASMSYDFSNYANVAICSGEAPQEGDSFTQAVVEVGLNQSAARHELYVDGAEVTHKYQIQNGDGTTTEAEYTEAEYITALQNYAIATLLKHQRESTCNISTRNITPIYGVDYQLGDKMPIIIPELGLRLKAVVKAVKMIYEVDGMTINVIFGEFEEMEN